MSKEQYPNKIKQGKNLAKFTMNVVKDVVVGGVGTDNIFASENKQKKRLDLCHECEYYSISDNRCKQCGCWLVYKVKFNTSICPIGKW